MKRLFFVLILVMTVPFYALDSRRDISLYSMKVWDMESGLPGNSIFALHQTKDGYLWIGTQDSLVRFDGIKFEVFNTENTPALGGNDIRALYEDSTGVLWIGGYSGGLVQYKDGKFTAHSPSHQQPISNIRAISEDRWGNLWVGSLNKGLFCLKNGQWISYNIFSMSNEPKPKNQVRKIIKDKNNNLWITSYTCIAKLRENFTFQNVLLPQKIITTSHYDAENRNLWIGTGGEGLFLLKDGKTTSYDIGFGNSPSPINVIYEDSEKNLWIGTDLKGLKRLGSDSILNCGSVYSIYEDKEKGLWIGTLDRGLYRLWDSQFITYSVGENINGNLVNCLYETRNGELYAGTKDGLYKLNWGKFTLIPFPHKKISPEAVTCLSETSDNILLIGTPNGIYRLENGILVPLAYKNRSGSGTAAKSTENKTISIHEDYERNTWVGTETRLLRLDSSFNIQEEFNKFNITTGNCAEFIFASKDGGVWIGTQSGVYFIKNSHISEFKLPGRTSYSAKCGFEDKNGTFWFGSGKELFRIKNKTKNSSIESIPSVWGDIDIASILEDNQKNLWLAGKKGIVRVNKQDLEKAIIQKKLNIQWEMFTEKDGIKSRCCTGNTCKSKNGTLWFPTTLGVAMIDPDRIKTKRPPIPVIIEKLATDGEDIPIQQAFTENSTLLELSPGKKRLELFYTAPSYINPQKIKFQIILEGYDKDWVDAGTHRIAVYTNLSPGQYTFRVRPVNSDGTSGANVASFHFRLRPYFYQTIWFYIILIKLILIITGITMFTIIKYRSRKLEMEKQKLAEVVEERTRELSEKNQQLKTQAARLQEQSVKLQELDKVKSRFFANISHEFRTPLTLIMGPMEQIIDETRDKDLRRKTLLMFRNSQRLLKLINQLLQLSRFDSGMMKLRAAYGNIIPFLKGILYSFDSFAAENDLELIFKATQEELFLYFDPEKLEEVISNLLSNAVKFTPAGGQIILEVRTIGTHIQDQQNQQISEQQEGKAERTHLQEDPNQFLEISIKDTGPGIPVEQLGQIFDRFFQSDSTVELHRKGSGIGLAIAREIVELHHGTIEAQNIRDEKAGSRFVVTLPLGKAHLSPAEIVDPHTVSYQPPKDFCLAPLSSLEAGVPEEEEYRHLDGLELTPQFDEPIQKEIILIIEDSTDVRMYIREALKANFDIVEASGGKEGLKKAREIIPDLIICDIMMPDVDGFEVCRELKHDIGVSHIPIILLTARAGDECMIEGLEAGADDYITKPFNIRVLSAKIKNLIELRRQLQQSMHREMTFQPTQIAVSNIDQSFLQDLKKVIDENLSESEFNVDQLCKKLYMSRTTVYRKIHALSGESPTDFIRSYRLKRAAQLLKSRNTSVTEVAFEVGFSSRAYFTKCFREKFHQLPSDFGVREGSV